LAFCDVLCSIGIPLSPTYPKEIITIADHLRKRQLEVKLSQAAVARRIGVSEDTITYWENGRTVPLISAVPAVIAFLGYNPYEVDTSTLGGKVKQFRLMKGLSLKNFAKMLRVAPSTVKSWEDNEFTPASNNYKRLMDSLNRFESSL
jgi:DNA-binding transcriptional regulator YiaG